LGQNIHVGVNVSRYREIIFEVFQPICVNSIPERHRRIDVQTDGQTSCCRITVRCVAPRGENALSNGATENAGVENAIRSKMQGWNMQEWKSREQIAGLENAGVGLLYGKLNGDYSERQP